MFGTCRTTLLTLACGATVLFASGGSASLNLAGCKGDFRLKWIDVLTGQWGEENKIVGGKRVTISAPDSGSWIAAMIRL